MARPKKEKTDAVAGDVETSVDSNEPEVEVSVEEEPAIIAGDLPLLEPVSLKPEDLQKLKELERWLDRTRRNSNHTGEKLFLESCRKSLLKVLE